MCCGTSQSSAAGLCCFGFIKSSVSWDHLHHLSWINDVRAKWTFNLLDLGANVLINLPTSGFIDRLSNNVWWVSDPRQVVPLLLLVGLSSMQGRDSRILCRPSSPDLVGYLCVIQGLFSMKTPSSAPYPSTPVQRGGRVPKLSLGSLFPVCTTPDAPPVWGHCSPWDGGCDEVIVSDRHWLRLS